MTTLPPRSTLFPTRRSSDLRDEDARLAGAGHDIRALQVLRPPRGDRARPTMPCLSLEWLLNSATSQEEAPSWKVTASSDRKSTRLNSSHRCISYAVFCLKKK